MLSLALTNITCLRPCIYHDLSRRRVRDAGIMVPSRETTATTAEQSLIVLRRCRSAEHRRKRQRIVSSETETHAQIQTLEPNLTRASSSPTRHRTHSHARRQGVSRRKSSRTLCQRRWTYSARDFSNYNGDV